MGIKLSNASNVNHEETQHNLILTQIFQQFIVSNFIPILKRTTIAYFYVRKACDNNVHKNRAWKIEHTHNFANKLFNNYLLKKCVYSILHTLYSWFVNIILPHFHKIKKDYRCYLQHFAPLFHFLQNHKWISHDQTWGDWTGDSLTHPE